MQQLTKQVLFK